MYEIQANGELVGTYSDYQEALFDMFDLVLTNTEIDYKLVTV